MEWGNLDRAGAEFRVDEGVLNEWDVPADERKDKRTLLVGPVAGVVRMDGHGHVAKHGFRTGRGHHDAVSHGPIFGGITNEPKRPGLALMVYL